MYQRNGALFIHIPALNQVGFHKVNRNSILGKVIQDMFGMIMMGFLTIIREMGCLQDYTRQTNVGNNRYGELY